MNSSGEAVLDVLSGRGWFGFFAIAGLSNEDVALLSKATSESVLTEKGQALAHDQGLRFEDWDAPTFHVYYGRGIYPLKNLGPPRGWGDLPACEHLGDKGSAAATPG